MRCQTRAEQRLAADCLQRPLRSRFRQRLKAGVMPLEENTLAHWFFDVLYKNHEFCQELGRLVLAAGKFETVLKQYLSEKGISVDEKRATMGSLVNRLKEHNYTSTNIEIHLKDLTNKRNYLIHSLCDLFSYRIEETILERENLVEEDVDMFIYRVKTLAEEFEFFSGMVHDEFTRHNNSLKLTPHSGAA